jgi:hypothetical protein
MSLRALLLIAGLACHLPVQGASPVASGRHWQLSIDSVACEFAESRITLGARIRYLGPRGVVEAPVSRLVDGNGKRVPPRSLVWKGGGKDLAAWLSAGGLRNVQSELASEVQLRFEPRDVAGGLSFEFGDIGAIVLTRSAPKGFCEGLLKPAEIKAPRKPSTRTAGAAVKAYRAAYPCQPGAHGSVRSIEAQYPPYLPEHLLVFGRGYLPNLREVQLPMGVAPAQSYAYSGPEELNAIEDAAQRAAAADFPQYRGSRYYAFNWGTQKAASGNDMYSIGFYAIRACPR